jgi:hypothetical protein
MSKITPHVLRALPVLLGVSLSIPTKAAAQTPRAFSAGVSASMAGIPGAFFAGCSLERHEPGTGIAADLGFRTGGWLLSTRTGIRDRAVLRPREACIAIPIVHESGTHTDAIYPYDKGSYAYTELRVGRRFSAGVEWHTDLGGGYSWKPHSPFGMVAAGFRLGERFRFGLDLEFRAERVVHDLVTRTWEDFVPVAVVGTERQSQWIVSPGIRFLFDLQFVRR